mgnify:CR=1 FL=1
MTEKTLLFLALFTMITTWAGAEPSDKCFEKMPFGCFIIKSRVISREQTNAVARKLGAPLKKLSNTDRKSTRLNSSHYS